jgi:hypothetical protein
MGEATMTRDEQYMAESDAEYDRRAEAHDKMAVEFVRAWHKLQAAIQAYRSAEVLYAQASCRLFEFNEDLPLDIVYVDGSVILTKPFTIGPTSLTVRPVTTVKARDDGDDPS